MCAIKIKAYNYIIIQNQSGPLKEMWNNYMRVIHYCIIAEEEIDYVIIACVRKSSSSVQYNTSTAECSSESDRW